MRSHSKASIFIAYCLSLKCHTKDEFSKIENKNTCNKRYIMLWKKNAESNSTVVVNVRNISCNLKKNKSYKPFVKQATLQVHINC